MDIAIVGPDPAAEPIRGAFADIEANVMEVNAGLLDGFDFAVVVGTTGDDAFRTATRLVDDWVAVEIGGVGGRAIEGLDAAVTVFSADTGCYDCLRDRVRANVPTTDTTPQGTRSAVRFAGALAGRRAIQHLSGDGVAGTVTEVDGPERRFLPSPGCDCGAASTGFELRAPEEPVGLDDAVDRMDRAVDDRLGVVTEVGERESVPAPYYIARTTDTAAFADTRCAEFGAGVAADWDAAYAKAIGEALERYCAGTYRASSFRSAPTAGVVDAVPVDRFVRPADAETPESDDHIPWVSGIDLASRESASLPAEFVVFPPPEERFAPAITTGLGLGNSTAEAVLSGLYETVERDASMLAWYSTFEPMGLDVDDEGFETLRKRARAEDLSVTALLLTQDVDVPVVGAAVHRDAETGEWPRFAMGSAADLDAAAAARSALAEALQNWMELRAMGPEQASREEGAIGSYADFPERVRQFVSPDVTLPAGDVTDADAAELDGVAEVEAVVDRLAAADLDAYAARLTTRDVAALGFEGVRVLVPEAQPLFTGEPFFGDRLESVSASMGFEPEPDRAYHPFP
ncbi:bacteriocin biosynthesis protein SagD [Halobaculum sp. WSA2]|uniref:Bacteriocin biosynthesis protein SagD n=1 Tax=Halobaculum saliterrae TaxID=2073113 RepID=A0A6B0T1T7_9EURY|nr:YcaO-like family protein [Halobaculum saliterrae]MXR42753.1 bacteriocin biosynthesis protein SagD [Halobaculum saliterrae]